MAANVQGLQYNTSISATTSGQGVSFGFNALNVLAVNDGANTVYIDFTSSSAPSTGMHPLKLNESVTVTAKAHGFYTGLTVITSTSTGAGPVATVRVLATR